MTGLYYDFSNVIFVLLTAFFCFLISLLVANNYRKTALWISIKAVKLEPKNITLATYIIIVSTVFIAALLYSGPLMVLSGLPICILFVLSAMSLAFTPIVFGSILSRFIFRNERYVDAKSTLYGVLYLLLMTVLPYYIGFVFIFIITLYTFGICADYIYKVLINNKNML